MVRTVRDFLKTHTSKNIWLCPNEQSTTGLKQAEYEYGITFNSVKSIPDELLNAEVVKAWKEEADDEKDDKLCVIWKNFRLSIDK